MVDQIGISGQYLVTTQGATYLLDLDRRTIARYRGDYGVGLRRDGETLPLIGVVRCVVGSSASFVVRLLPGIDTRRETTPVTGINIHKGIEIVDG